LKIQSNNQQMKFVRNLIVWSGILLSFVACQKEYSVETGNGGSTINSEWEFKEAANEFAGPIDTAFIETLSGLQFLSVEGTSAGGQETILLQVIGAELKPGTYGKGQALFSYIKSGTTTLYETDLSGDFSIVISRIDSIGVSGTFSGKVVDGSGVAKTITNGKFSASLKSGTTPPPSNATGKVVAWASAGCAASASGPLTVKISTQTGTISSFVTTEPTCGATGSANFTLPVGTYTWKAFCGTTDSISGLVTVTENGCAKIKVDFAVPPTNCKISKWLEYDLVSGKPEWSYVNTYGATGTNPVKFEWYDSSTSKLMAPAFNFNYAADKITVDAAKNQYFVTGPDGKVTEFWGFSDPAFDTTAKVVVKYFYNGSDQLVKRTEAEQATPNTVDFVYDYSYTNGNLSKVTVKDGATSTLLADVTFQYTTETVKNFLALYPASFELMYFQQAINIGKPSSSAKLTQATTTVYTPTPGAPSTTTFGNYVIDATTRQVLSFDVGGADFGVLGFYKGYKYKLEYKCF